MIPNIPAAIFNKIPPDRVGGLVMVCEVHGADVQLKYFVDGWPWEPGGPLPPADRCRSVPAAFRTHGDDSCDTSSKPS